MTGIQKKGERAAKAAQARDKRLAEQLRANLKRRKTSAKPEEPCHEAPAGPDGGKS